MARRQTEIAAELARRGVRVAAPNPLARYHDDPVAYATERLGVRWWAKQQEIARALLEHPKVLVKASHSVGKTHLSAGLVLWWYETRDPSITLTTAPTEAQVVDLLWREVRGQAPGAVPLLPKAPRIEGGGSHHYAAGYTARDANAFQGRHEADLLVVFDEAVGVGGEFWVAAEGMLTGPGNRWLAILNTTDATSPAYAAEESGDWHVITVSALEHPNIAAELAGDPPPFPKAVRLWWVAEKVAQWCSPTERPAKTDLEWPPGSRRWHKPGPLFESRVLGRWPSQATNAVWSDALLALAFREGLEPLPEPADLPCEIGCDVARYGDDMTVVHVRRGPVSLWHERHNGWGTDQTAGRLKQLAREWAAHCGLADPKQLAVKIDDDGVGGGVTDQADGYRFIGCSGAHAALEREGYPNRRSEVWFATAQRALEDGIDLSRLDAASRRELRIQLMAPRWRVDSQGRRQVEPKDETKKRLGRSPDDADALNLAYAPGRPAIQVTMLQPQGKARGWEAQRIAPRKPPPGYRG